MPLFAEEGPGSEIISTTVRLRRRMLDRLDAIAKRETALRKAANKRAGVISRNDVIERFLEQSCDAYEHAEADPGHMGMAAEGHEEYGPSPATERPREPRPPNVPPPPSKKPRPAGR